jgi:hypothetical protein
MKWRVVTSCSNGFARVSICIIPGITFVAWYSQPHSAIAHIPVGPTSRIRQHDYSVARLRHCSHTVQQHVLYIEPIELPELLRAGVRQDDTKMPQPLHTRYYRPRFLPVRRVFAVHDAIRGTATQVRERANCPAKM